MFWILERAKKKKKNGGHESFFFYYDGVKLLRGASVCFGRFKTCVLYRYSRYAGSNVNVVRTKK